jgi:hypothetical protein
MGAQVTLNDFNAFESDNTFFVGNWEAGGGASTTPRSSFSQGAGFYNLAGGSNADSAYVEYFFNAPVNITGLSLLQLSAELLPGNTAARFDVALFDLDGNSTLATFFTSSLSTASFLTLSANLDFSGFHPTEVSSFRISGNAFVGADTLSVAVGNLALAAPISAVPEPSTYGLAAALALAGIAGFRRFGRFAE